MLQMTKKFLCAILLASGLQAAWGFSFLGPLIPDPGGEPWQVPAIGYNLPYIEYGYRAGGLVWLGDIGGPHNLAEEYRRNVPVLFYSYDANFLDYFGMTGVTNVSAAFDIMNSLTNVSSYSVDLSEFPMESQQYNYTAESLYLTDIKSVTLHLLVEQMGLADPERYTWTLHDRAAGSKCPLTTTYSVVQRNFDVLNSPLNQVQYSPYVNGVLYTYYIQEICAGAIPLGVTVPFSVDFLNNQYTSVAANNYDTFGGLQIGGYYTGLTRDDVAGLRYLLGTNNINREAVPPGSQLFTITTNLATQQLFPNGTGTNATGTNALGFYYYDGVYGYGDLQALLATSATNGPAVLQAMYPGLMILSYSNYFVIASNATVTSYYANGGVGSPYGTLKLVTVTNYTPYLLEKFAYKFGNIFTNHYSSKSVSVLQNVTVAPQYGSPYPGVSTTNITSQTLVNTNLASGDFFLFTMFQTNICPLNILYTGLTNVISTTNLITSASTNVTTGTNAGSYAFYQILITRFTNYTFVIHPVTCGFNSNSVGLYQGIERVQFVRADYDSLVGQYFQPITNNYIMYALVNSQLQRRYFQKIVTQPDILLSAQDLAVGPAGNNFNGTVVRGINFDSTQILPGLKGPGIIYSPSTFTYNKVGPLFNNGPFASTNGFLNSVNETTQFPALQWASFDGSTNDPVLYPNGTSIQELENHLFVQVTPPPPGVPDGTNGVAYTPLTFTASGGAFSPPFTWSATGLPGTGQPADLQVYPDGTFSGTPSAAGTFDFILQLTDSLGRSVQWNYTIIIH
jgi:hypothetical protein